MFLADKGDKHLLKTFWRAKIFII